MDSRLDSLIATLSSLAKAREEHELIATAITVQDIRYDLSKKMAKESGVEEIIKQLLGRLENAFGSIFTEKREKNSGHCMWF